MGLVGVGTGKPYAVVFVGNVRRPRALDQELDCIVEAMKLMNEIESDVAGEIIRIHPENGHPVQFGEPLFTIKTA